MPFPVRTRRRAARVLAVTVLGVTLSGALAAPSAYADTEPPAEPAVEVVHVPAPSAPTAPVVVVPAVLPATPTLTLGQQVVAEAARHEGAPYVYGAAGPTRFDCSGFTRYVYGRFGKVLPHNSTAQYRATARVAQQDKQPGDLLFVRSSSGAITHVGIYAGSGSWWVAPKTGDRVKLQRVYTTRYSVGRVR